MEAKASSTSTLTTGSEALVTLSWLRRALASAPGQVTQWEVLGAVPQIGEAWLIPVLAAMPKPSGSSMKSHFNPV